MNWSASAISTVSSDTEPTIVVTFDNAKYVFNAGENTGRAWLQSRSYWRRTKALFLTSVGTQRGSGVPGLLMFVADAGIQKVSVHGPPGLTHFLASMRSYLSRDTISVDAVEVESSALPSSDSKEPSAVFKDENITVYAISLQAQAQDLKSPDADGPSSESRLRDEHLLPVTKRKRTPSPPSFSKRPHLASPPGKVTQLSPQVAPSTTPDAIAGPSWMARLRAPRFTPSFLRGAEAREWRRFIIARMFPVRPLPELSPDSQESNGKKKRKQSKKGKDKSETEPTPVQNPDTPETSAATVAPPRLPKHDPYPFVGPHHNRRLPVHSHSHPSNMTKASDLALCYVIVGPRMRGKFDAKKADELGLKFGPLRGRLTKGHTVTVTVSDGHGGTIERTVKPEDCMGPSEPPQTLLILDVPSTDHIPSLVDSFQECSYFGKFRSRLEEDRKEWPVHAVFHLCGEGVLEDSRYRSFVNGFSAETHHLVASREHAPDPITFTNASFNQLMLNRLDSDMFPVPKYRLTPAKDLHSIPDLPPKTTLLKSNICINMRPPRDPAPEKMAEEYDKFHPAVTSQAPLCLSSPTAEAFAQAQALVADIKSTNIISARPGHDVTIVPLGTSSAVPSKYRNVSSTLIQIPKWGNILLDAGEGTWGQLARLFGDDLSCSTGVWQMLRDLKCIFLSHMHGDHHIGLAKILAMRRKLNPPPSEPLYVVGLRFHLLYLQELSDLEDLGLDNEDENGVVSILSDALNWRGPRLYGPTRFEEPWMDMKSSQTLATDMCHALGLSSFVTVDVNHQTRCYGAVIKHSDGWSIVFSADTMPSENLVSAGQNATLLIHEASMGDDQEQLAKLKAHSTLGQALDVGNRMHAENILLTHFSARYPKMPPSLADPAESSDLSKPTVALAFDHAVIPIGDMWKLRACLPAIEKSFADIAEEDDEDPNPAAVSW